MQAELSAERRTRQMRVVEITVSSKTCRQCAERKHVSAFNRNKNNPDGLASYCKPCRSANEAGARVNPVIDFILHGHPFYFCNPCSQNGLSEVQHGIWKFSYISMKLMRVGFPQRKAPARLLFLAKLPSSNAMSHFFTTIDHHSRSCSYFTVSKLAGGGVDLSSMFPPLSTAVHISSFMPNGNINQMSARSASFVGGYWAAC